MSVKKAFLVVITMLSSLYGSVAPAVTPAYSGVLPVDYSLAPAKARYDCVTSQTGSNVDIEIVITDPGSLVNTYAISNTSNDYKLRNSSIGETVHCTKGLTKIEPSSMNFTLQDCNADTKLYLHFLTREEHKPIIFDKNYYILELNCKGGSGKAYSVNEQFTDVKDKNKLTPVIPDLRLVMTIEQSSGVGEIHVGDSLTLKVTDNSDPPQRLAFKNCFADNTERTDNKNIQLILNGVSTELSVIASVGKFQQEGSQSITMTAFRFEGDNPNVRINCTIVACDDGSSCSVTARRRRATNDGIRGMVQATYTVSDKKEASGQDKVLINMVMMSILLLLPKLLCWLG